MRPRRPDRRGGFAFNADRCAGCGWYVNRIGRYDPKFVGHSKWCPVVLFPAVETASDLHDQWQALEALAAASAPLGDYLDWQRPWHEWAAALVKRSEMLGLEDAPLMEVAEAGPGPGRAW
jgi:hypothetical protein